MGGLDVVDPRFGAIYERAVEVLRTDERVASVELSGSLADGTADAWSDLDLRIVAHADAFDTFLADWPRWLDAITPTVFARTPVAPFIINTVTNEGLTFDLVVHKGEVFEFSPPSGYAVGMLSGTRFAEVADALEYAVAEQLRGLAGPFISLVQRDEHLRHLAGVPHLIGLLTTVFLAELGAPPPGKHWNRTFTAEQLATVGGLPPVSATRDGVVAFGLGLARLVVTRGRALYPDLGLRWPEAFARVTADRVRATLGIEIGDWLY